MAAPEEPAQKIASSLTRRRAAQEGFLVADLDHIIDYR